MQVDLTQVMQAVISVAGLSVIGAIPLFGKWLKSHLTFIKNQTLQTAAGALVDDVDQAAAQAAGAAYSWAQKNAANISHLDVRNVAIGQGLAFVGAVAPELIAAAGGPAAMSAKIDAEFGNLLAADPNVSIAAPIAKTTSLSLDVPASAPAPSPLVLAPAAPLAAEKGA